MDVTSLQPVWAYLALQNLLLTLQATQVAFGAIKIHLAKAGPGSIDSSWTIGDFTEADFTGYASQVITPTTPPVNLQTGRGLANVENALFTCTTAPVAPGQQIVGYWIDSGASPVPLVAELFPAPVPIVNAGDYVNLAAYIGAAFVVQTP